MTIRTAVLTVTLLLLALGTFAQGNRLGAEAQGAKDGHAQQVQAAHPDQAEMPVQAYATFAPGDMPAAAIHPALPQPLNFWADILPVCTVVAAIWLTFLILGLTLNSSIASGVFLLLMAWTAVLGVGALLLVIIALVQLSTRSERVARRAHDPMWRVKRWRTR